MSPKGPKASAEVAKTSAPAGDPAGYILPDQREALRAIFAPKSVAVVGVSRARMKGDPTVVEAILDL